jgi:hypothetical protein
LKKGSGRKALIDIVVYQWTQHGVKDHPNATCLLLLCDGGGSNASNRHVFKEALHKLSDSLGLEIRIAHDPLYCSKSGFYVTGKKVTTDFLKTGALFLIRLCPVKMSGLSLKKVD